MKREGGKDHVNAFIIGSWRCADGSGCNRDCAGTQQPLNEFVGLVFAKLADFLVLWYDTYCMKL